MKRIYIVCFLIIIVIGFILRFYKLGEVPNGFHRDEAFLGYNAYSILKTGKDINGNFLPTHLESFLYTPAGYAYVSLPFILIFDLNEFSVRFASALFGFLTIILLYFLAKEFFTVLSLKHVLPRVTNQQFGLVASFFLAISPWHINLSRTASVVPLSVFFTLLGLFFLLYWLKGTKILQLIFAFVFFGISLCFYIAPYSLLPLFVPVAIFLLGFHMIKKRKNLILVSFLYIVIIIVPLFLTVVSPTLSLRMRSLSLIHSQQGRLVLEEHIREDGVAQVDRIQTRAFHNKVHYSFLQFTQNYFKHVSYDFLFTDQGFPDRYRIPQVGLLYLFEIPLLIFGVIMLLQIEGRKKWFLLVWILLVPVGSALTFDDIPNLQRTLFMSPALSLLSAIGAFRIWIFLRDKKQVVKVGILSSVVVIGMYTVFFYLHQYYLHSKVYRPWFRQDGYKELVEKVNTLLPKYEKTIVTNRESGPTLFFLLYSKYDPSFFQHDTKNSTLRDFDRVGFGKYEFSEEECPLRMEVQDGIAKSTGKKGILYVNSSLCKESEGIEKIATIKRSDNSEVFYIVGVK